jgi:octaprenyl-diphosphate synthase
MLAVLDQMIRAESLQLDNRGRVDAGAADYFHIVEGKTAALFRWALHVGGLAGGAPAATCAALERFGHHLGVAFQAVDDLLDYAPRPAAAADGADAATGKTPLADLREGKMTYPLVVALEREPALRPLLSAALAAGAEGALSGATAIAAAVERTGALARTRALAAEHVARAIACLAPLPDGPARTALATVAEATTYRER